MTKELFGEVLPELKNEGKGEAPKKEKGGFFRKRR
jgi:hypothetical protein